MEMTVQRHRFTKGLREPYPFTWESSILSDMKKIIGVAALSDLSPLNTNEVTVLVPCSG